MRRLAAVAVAAGLLLSGCANDLDGRVVSKRANPGYVVIIPITTSTGKSSTTTMIPFWIPACFEITVSGPSSGDTCIAEDEWAAIEVGDSYVGPDVDPEDRKVRR